jgi:hypothetical protein
MRSLYVTGHKSPATESTNECRGRLFLAARGALTHSVTLSANFPGTHAPKRGERERPHMHRPARSHSALDRFALERLGEMLRGRYHLPATLPSRVYDLMKKLDDPCPSIAPDANDLAAASKERHYRRQAVETMRAAQHTSSSAVRNRLVTLAEAWIELAEKARKTDRL